MGIFDIFTNKNAQDAANAQIAGINSGLQSATGAINQGSQDLTTNYTAALQPFLQNYATGSAGQTQYANALGLNGGPAGAQAAASAYASNPAFQFQLNQGNQNVLRNSAQTGTTASGATLDALQQQGQGLANSTYQQYVQNLQPFLGQANAAASGIGSTYTGLGNALNSNQGNLANLNWNAATGIGNANANADLANNAADKNIWGAISGVGGLLGGSGVGNAIPGGSGGSGSGGINMQALTAMLSDARWKEDIKPVGELHDGQPVYSYRYVFDDPAMTRIGLMAQDVEKTNPDAVIDVDGVKMVDYGRATSYAAELARFSDADNVVPFKSREAPASPADVFARFLEAA